MILPVKKPEQGQKAGKFGYSGKMIIKAYSIPEEQKEKYKKRFLKLVKIRICGCWEWQGRIHNGYGCCPTPGGNTKWAHRVSYALFKGPIKEQMHIDHICRNSKCVNPTHLQQVTPQENYLAISRRKKREIKKAQEKAGQMRIEDLL